MRSGAERLGRWSAASLAGIGGAYATVLAFGVARHGLKEPIADPILAVMEVLTLLAAPALVGVLAAIHARAAPAAKAAATVALAFGTLCAGTTSAVHFVELTAGRQLGGAGLVWLSRAYAAELLAWDVFLGLSLVFAAATFAARGRERTLRRALFVCGAMCLCGTVGPLVGEMRLQLVGVAGYAVVLPVVAVLLARSFAAAGERPGGGA